MIDKNKIFGFPVKAMFAWTLLQFFKIPKLFKKLGLSLSIGGREIKTFRNFIMAIINPKKKLAQEAIEEIEKTINAGCLAGIDISINFWDLGLFDHVMFVYGYDEDNLYVFDTHQVLGLEYKKITEDNRFIMKISKNEIKKRWTCFGRVWIINKIS